jgi:hypothetical protein
MTYLKSVLAGIAGSILGVLLFVIIIIILNVPEAAAAEMTGISAIPPLGLIVLGFIDGLGFVAGYYLMFRKLRRRTLLNQFGPCALPK